MKQELASEDQLDVLGRIDIAHDRFSGEAAACEHSRRGADHRVQSVSGIATAALLSAPQKLDTWRLP
ncbi:hypothetical protein [Bradyrhizobium glycinis]|uniref:hypothetical protein n=1 Tax=Bradyrhizobium glycinis TaxID=2751812 RepID=UPI0018D7E6D2|nr:hypothetical protein [Bradyrhizobium glycinis]MBH5372923.1 hypothetical protein [Bradyrhizobium glycinis]